MPGADVIPMPRRAKSSSFRCDTDLMSGWSMEATLPRSPEIARLADVLAAGTLVFMSALPRASFDEQLEAARGLRRVGLEPVPHLAARQFRSAEELGQFLTRGREEAGIERYLLVGGDLDRPRGPYASSLDILRSDEFLGAGVCEVGCAGYPEGHPVIDDRVLDAALDAKLAVARGAGLDTFIVSQFCFNASAIVAWYERLRVRGVSAPVRIGLPGPASARTLLNFALRCGVALPLRKANVASRLLHGVAAEDIIRVLDACGISRQGRSTVSLHFFAFGGIEKTARWARNAEAGAVQTDLKAAR